jgi:glycine cleavage system aminomethyltransferase T
VGWQAWRAAGVAAGLPHWGHDLGGPGRISPIQSGYGAEIAAHKPFFVGRWPLITQPHPPTHEIVRFRVLDTSTDAPRPGDPLVDESGICLGTVTSGPLVAGTPIGLAFADRAAATVGSQVRIAVGAGAQRSLEIGEPIDVAQERAPVVTAEVLPRFGK